MTNDYGRFVWYDLMSPDTEASKTFYTRVLGWGTRVDRGVITCA
jgi:predicted enzyme related to lactoylglutathione lyase